CVQLINVEDRECSRTQKQERKEFRAREEVIVTVQVETASKKFLCAVYGHGNRDSQLVTVQRTRGFRICIPKAIMTMKTDVSERKDQYLAKTMTNISTNQFSYSHLSTYKTDSPSSTLGQWQFLSGRSHDLVLANNARRLLNHVAWNGSSYD
ncbi:hypothetical protein STEG23_016610, partial [Scotinomys teguina]